MRKAGGRRGGEVPSLAAASAISLNDSTLLCVPAVGGGGGSRSRCCCSSWYVAERGARASASSSSGRTEVLMRIFRSIFRPLLPLLSLLLPELVDGALS